MGAEFTKFNYAIKGYNIQEVDRVIEKMARELGELKRRNEELSNTVMLHKDEILKLTESCKKAEEDRVNESLRITSIMSKASRMAEKMEEDAAYKADEILRAARNRAEKLQESAKDQIAQGKFILHNLSKCLGKIREDCLNFSAVAVKQIDALDAVLGNALKDVQ